MEAEYQFTPKPHPRNHIAKAVKKMENKNKIKDLQSEKKMLCDVAYYQEFVSAWIHTRIERSRHILTLSSLAIGVLVVVDGPRNEIIPFFIWAVAGVLFISSILGSLRIFNISSDHIERLIHDKPPEDEERIEKSLQRLMNAVYCMLVSGIILTFFWVAYNPVIELFWGPMINLLCGGK